MKQSFAKTASRLRAEGQSTSAGIRASAERQRTVILADADRDALQVRGEGDAAAAQIYARAYSRNPSSTPLSEPPGLRALLARTAICWW